MQALLFWHLSPSCYFSLPPHCSLCLLHSHYFPDFSSSLFPSHLGRNEPIWSISRPFPGLLVDHLSPGMTALCRENLSHQINVNSNLGFWLMWSWTNHLALILSSLIMDWISIWLHSWLAHGKWATELIILLLIIPNIIIIACGEGVWVRTVLAWPSPARSQQQSLLLKSPSSQVLSQ